jgi:hypothetical protein
MSNTKHTPGPWQHGANYGACVYVFDENRSYNIATLGPTPVMGGSCEANARLIAAAPELLEALKEMMHYRSWAGDWWQVEHAKNMARAAIAKATGQ